MECKYYGYNGEDGPLCESNYEHAAHSARACSGLDMRKVPEGAVEKLVLALSRAVDYPLDVRNIPWLKDAEAALAPFKE